ncbi:MAG: hypothetical protein IPN18_20165 [Ignavibacteriales bacterium]|nr:hypothetical protein [Ignavibacteriales bacterium]
MVSSARGEGRIRLWGWGTNDTKDNGATGRVVGDVTGDGVDDLALVMIMKVIRQDTACSDWGGGIWYLFR